MSKNRQQTYSQALSELEKIVADIEAEEVDIDVLAEKIKRATHLMKFCRSRLRSAEEEVKKALSEAAETVDTTPAAEEEPNGY